MFGKLKSPGRWKVGSVKVPLEMEAKWTPQTSFPEVSRELWQPLSQGTGTEITLPDHRMVARHVSLARERQGLEWEPLPSEPLHHTAQPFWSKDLWLFSSRVALGFMSLLRLASGTWILTRPGVSRFLCLYNASPHTEHRFPKCLFVW